jgi:hypothetical protein
MRVNVKKWKDDYLYTDMHEIFFVEFPCLSYEWLKGKLLPILLCGLWNQWFGINPHLKVLNDNWNWAIEFWFSRVKEGYIVEFVVEYVDSFSEVERKFMKGLRKYMLEEIPLWINMLFVEKGIMHMDPDRMVE